MATDETCYTETMPNTGLRFSMLHVPGGTFLMGSPKNDADAYPLEQPQHLVTLAPFLMAEYPVTQGLWVTVMGNNPAHFEGPQRPVEQVSWFDAIVFCNALSEMTGRKPVYRNPGGQMFGKNEQGWGILATEKTVLSNPLANGYRLPSEAQWEFAANYGATSGGKYAGAALLDQVGWHVGNSSEETREVGQLAANALGLHDMCGNVWEWCFDWFGHYNNSAIENPTGPDEGRYRVVRGGSWGDQARFCRSTYRLNYHPEGRDFVLGLRLVLAEKIPN